MRLTPQFVDALRVLKAAGYERVASWVGNYRDTTYVKVWTIDDLIWTARQGGVISVLALPPKPRKGMWRGHMNTRHLTNKDIRTSRVIETARKLGL